MAVRSIDLNCDLGEGVGEPSLDAALLNIVSSANVACGGHAGDEESMVSTVREAAARKVAVGAHPSYPDRAGFGRHEMPMTDLEIETTVAAQVAALAEVAGRVGVALRHVKPHGALYHAAMAREGVARAIARGCRRAGDNLVLVGLAGSAGLETWRRMGSRVAGEAFADRLYEADGSLRPRATAGALIPDPQRAADQAVRIATEGRVSAASGTSVRIDAQTICVHSDTPGAEHIAAAVRAALERSGVRIAPLA